MTEHIDFLTLVKERYSVRSFKPQPVEQETLDLILKAGHAAPTACNLQPQRILVINSEGVIAKLQKCTKCHFHAPAALLVCYDKDQCWKRSYDGKSSGEIDAAIVTTHMMLEAASLGVGTTWVMHFIPDAMREEFQIPENLEPAALLVMGYPAADAKPYPGHGEFKPEGDIVSYNQF